MVLLLAVWNCFYMPIGLAFGDIIEFDDNEYIKIFDIAVDAFFLLDVILMFFTSYLATNGAEIRDSYKIAIEYMSTSRFLTDTLSLLGTGLFEKSYLKPFGFFKLMRIFRIGKLIKRLTISKENKSILNMLKLMFYIILWFHVIACFLWMVLHQNLDKTRR